MNNINFLIQELINCGLIISFSLHFIHYSYYSLLAMNLGGLPLDHMDVVGLICLQNIGYNDGFFAQKLRNYTKEHSYLIAC